ncbi:MAG: acetamidase/formamidase family protein [Phycisphaeraceae bacterium]|nr:acetamidase/formamidase family protein [Phycisphaeraceae bacterium]
MKTFARQSITSHCVGGLWPEMLGRVDLGESFVLETNAFNAANGPIEILGIKAGEPIAVHVDDIRILPPFNACVGGPFIVGPEQKLEYRDGWFHWPDHFRLRAKPSIGNVAVLPQPTDEILEMSRQMSDGKCFWPNERGWRRVVNDPRGKHCHQDCSALGVGATIHLKAQVDGAGLCLADVHGYIGQGEMGFAAIEVAADVRLRVERSSGWLVDWPLIETDDQIMVFSSYSRAYIHRPVMRYVDVAREAYHAMVEVVAHRIGGSFQDANTLVATAVDIRNCALYGLQGFISDDKSPHTDEIALVAALPKHVFA